MNVIDAIKARRSVRKFKEDTVPDDLLNEIIDAARWAPSGNNAQPWIFIIIKDKQLKEEIQSILSDRALKYIESDEGKKELEKLGPYAKAKWIEAIKTGKYQEHVRKAPVLIAVFGDASSPYYIHDCCAATENLILAAHEFGLGSCWIDHGIGDQLTESQIRSLLKTPKNLRLVSLIAMGFPAEMPQPRPRKAVEDITFLNEYGVKWRSLKNSIKGTKCEKERV